MNVLLLSPIISEINSFFEKNDVTYTQTHERILIESVKKLNPDFILSYRYRHIIDEKFLQIVKVPIVNLHHSFLPFNRGAHPNFWSFYEDTPKGISIHLIDKGIDTGDIIYQEEIQLDLESTFRETYKKLDDEIVDRFIKIYPDIVAKNYDLIKQKNKGTFHNASEIDKYLIKYPNLWDMKINSFLKKEKETN